MKGYLLDTNVLSEVLRKKPSPRVISRMRSFRASELKTSAVCAMELRYGAARHPRGTALWKRIHEELLSKISIIPLGMDEALKAGEILAELEARGEVIGIEDVLIAATALSQGLVVVSRNLRHFTRVPGLVAEDWWQESKESSS